MDFLPTVIILYYIHFGLCLFFLFCLLFGKRRIVIVLQQTRYNNNTIMHI